MCGYEHVSVCVVCVCFCVCIVWCYYFELAKDKSMPKPFFLAQNLHNYIQLLGQHK